MRRHGSVCGPSQTQREFTDAFLHSSQVEEKLRYAKWKAADITRCLKAGIKPKAGPPVDDEEEEDEDVR